MGDAVRFIRLVGALCLAGVPTVHLTGVANEEASDDKLVVRWRDANVELEGFEDEGVIGPETDRAEDTIDKRLVDLLGVSEEPETTRLATDWAGERCIPQLAGVHVEDLINRLA